MRRVGVQMQDLGTRLCWQVFIDDAGANLGLADLVHFAESPDLANLKQQDLPLPVTIKKPYSARIPFEGFLGNDDNGAGADYGDTYRRNDNVYVGHRTNTNEDKAEDREIKMGPFNYKFDLPQTGYTLSNVRILGPQGNKKAVAQPAVLILRVAPPRRLILSWTN